MNNFKTDQLGENWWSSPLLENDFRNTIRLYYEYRSMVAGEKCLKFDTLSDAMASLLRTYNKAMFREKAEQLFCICDLFEKAVPAERKARLVRTIDDTGFDTIRDAFETLMQACENKYQEKEDIIAILKRHRLSLPKPGSDREKLYRIGQLLTVALINHNLNKKKNHTTVPETLLNYKKKASMVIMPLVDEIFFAVFGEAVMDQRYVQALAS